MSQWYFLGCLECRICVDLHKFLPTDAWYEPFDQLRFDRDVFPGQPTYCVVKATRAQLLPELAAIRLDAEPDYVRALLPVLLEFVKGHAAHPLFIISDLGDQPWSFPEEEWWQ